MKSILTVTVPASDRLLLTAAEIRAAIGDDGSISDLVITTLGNRVAAAIARACKVAANGAVPPTLRLETLSEQFRPTVGRSELLLARRPVVSITSATENDDAALAASDYEFDAAAALLRRLSGDAPATWSTGKIVVVYRAGWETVPDDLKLAAAKLAAVFWSEGTKVDSGLKRESIPGLIDREWWVGPSDDPAVPREVMDLLSPYINHWIG